MEFSLNHLKEYRGRRWPARVHNAEPVDASEIRKCSYAVGDYNPLYTNPGYARNTRFSGVIGAPYFFYAIDNTAQLLITLPALEASTPKLNTLYAGTDWTFYGPVRSGDVIAVEHEFLDAEDKVSGYASKSGVLSAEIRYVNQRGELLATAIAHAVVAPAEAASKRSLYRDVSAIPVYSDADQRRIAKDKALGLRPRGAEPRFYEDTHEGDVITPVVQGPLWEAEIAIWTMGTRRGPDDPGFAGFPREPEAAMSSFEPDPWTSGHTSANPSASTWANRAIPRAFDSGPQRMSWLMRAVASWMGDDADLKYLKGKLIGLNLSGDCNYYTGQVTAKRVLGDEHLIDCDLRAHSQDGRTNTVGSCTIALPSKPTWRSESRTK